MTKIRGNELFQQKRFIVQNHGIETFNKIVESTKHEETKEIYSNPILSNQWYELEYYLDFVDAFEKILSRKERQRFDIEDVRKELKGIFGFALKFISRETLVSKFQDSWNKMFSSGKIEIIKNEKEFFLFRISDFKTSDPHLDGLKLTFKTMGEILTGEKVFASFEKIDESTTEFSLRKEN